MADGDALRDALRRMARALEQQADRFRELDARLGDGDLGITATALAEAMTRVGDDGERMAPAELLGALGRELARANPSTFSGFVRIGVRAVASAVAEEPALFADGRWPELLTIGIEGVQARGGAPLGAKTFLDALDGSRAALAATPARPGGLAAVAACGARERMDELRASVSAAGRASWQGERTAGELDPGAEVWVAAMEALSGDGS